MDKDLMLQFKALFGEKGNAVGQVRGIDRLSRLTEELFECIGLGRS